MAVVKSRVRYLFYLMSQSEMYFRASDLAERVHVTDRTIKADMQELADYAEEVGAQLVSKKGKGYRIVEKDSVKLQEVKKQLVMHYLTMGNNQNSQSIRINQMIRRLMIEEGYLTVEELAEEMFLSKSTIREELKKVNEILDAFHLKWKKKHESGPLIQGSELDRRMMMLCAFENHFHEAVNIFENEKFLYWFEYDEQLRYEIRHVFLKNLRESECHIRDDHTQRLSRYLCLMVNRLKKGHQVSFTETQRKYIQKLKQYQVSRKVMYHLMNYPGFESLPEDEIYAFGLLLAQWADVSFACNLEKNYPNQIGEAKSFLHEYEKIIWNEYGIRLSDCAEYESVLLRGLIPLMIQKDFNACSQIIRITYEQDVRVKECPLAAQMAYDAIFMFEKMYGVKLSVYNALSLSSQLHSLFLSIHYQIKPLRALICNANGLQSSYTLARLIESRYGGMFESLNCFELYEMRGLKQEDYDCAIMNLPLFSYKYDWPYLFVDTVPSQKQMNDIYNQLIVKAVEFDKVFEHLHLENINVYQNFNYENEDSFIKLLSFKMGRNSDAIDIIDRSLHLRSSVCVSNKVCVLFVKHWLVSNSIFDVYQLKNESDFAGEPVQYIVVLSFDFNGSLQAARFVNDVTYMFFNDVQTIRRLIANGQKDELKNIVRESFKALPISLVQGK